MFNINGWELAIILALFLIVFGPDRIPEVAAQLGKAVRDLRRMADQATSDLSRELAAAAEETRRAKEDLGEASDALRRAVLPTSVAARGATSGAPAADAPSDRPTAPPEEPGTPGAPAADAPSDRPTALSEEPGTPGAPAAGAPSDRPTAPSEGPAAQDDPRRLDGAAGGDPPEPETPADGLAT